MEEEKKANDNLKIPQNRLLPSSTDGSEGINNKLQLNVIVVGNTQVGKTSILT